MMEVVGNDATRYQDFVVIYEGPPSSSSHTTNSNNNRQIFCLSLPLPPSSTGHTNNDIIHDNDTIILLSSSSIALQLGYPESFLCITSSPSTHLNHHQHYENNSNDNNSNNILHVKLHPRLTSIRGGKGGFGTLLRGQSKQAGARTTVDFGACRDLSGRRLRHVNDEIKLRKWRELQAAAAARARHCGGECDDENEGEGGDATSTTKTASMTEMELAAIRTPSGIRNWHLSIPSWSEVSSQSNKGRRKVERQLVNEVYGWSKKEEYARSIKEGKKLEQERAIMEYVRRGEIEAVAATGGSGGGGNSSVKEGILLAHYKKRKESQPQQKKIGGTSNNDIKDAAVTTVAENDGTTITISSNKQPSSSDPFNHYTTTSTTSILPSANYLMTLSGEMLAYDIVTNDTTSKNLVRLQSQSDFATVVILLDTEKMSKRKESMGMYIEYTLQTAGIAQIGWVSSPSSSTNNSGIENNVDNTLSSTTKMFQPNSDTGDGVGDDNASYGYDGSRGLRFHNGKEYVYGSHSGGSDASTTIVEWKVGDVLGCYCKHQKQVVSECIYELGYTLNGIDLGCAFTVEVFDYYPAISLNMNEIVDVNIGPDFVYYDPKSNCVGVYEFMVVTTNSDADNDDDDDSYIKTGASDKSSINNEERNNSNLSKKRSRDEVLTGHVTNAEMMSIVATKGGSVDQPKKESNVSSDASFDLNKCSSVDEVKALGSERLKDIMLSMGVKCGGTLEERANRLFSLKGLQRHEFPTKVRGKNFILG